jgi:hypothetical protein
MFWIFSDFFQPPPKIGTRLLTFLSHNGHNYYKSLFVIMMARDYFR